MNQTVILVMAAGSSRRFGADKRQAPFGDTTLLQSTLDSAAQWQESIRVVIGPDDNKLQEQLTRQQITAYIAANAKQGMGHSLADAIQQLSATEPEINRCLVMLADMPYLKNSTLTVLLSELEKHELVVPTYNGKRGNPVGFGRSYFDALMGLTGDKGGKVILQNAGDAVREIPVDDPGILKDIDRPEQITKP